MQAIYNIPFKIPGSRTDRELLHFYCSEAAHCLSRLSDSTLWTQLILQRCQHQPVVRNSLVALSSLYREYLKVGSARLGSSPKSIQLMVKSHKQLSTYLLMPDATPDAALICSLIFYVFECLVGNARQAIWHLDQGLKLLKNYWVDDPALIAKMDPIYPQIKMIFCHLDVHATIFTLDRVPILQLASPENISGLSNVVPEKFSNVFEIEQALVILQNWKTNHLMVTVELKGVYLSQLPIEIAQERLRIAYQCRLYEKAIEAFRLEKFDQILEKHERQRVMLLHCQGLIFHGVLLENIILTENDKKTPMDAYCKFDYALDQLTMLVSDPEWSKKYGGQGRDFTVSTNMIALLYFVCLKTRDRALLERCLSLMQTSLPAARDGLWDSRKAYLVIQSILAEKDSVETVQEMDTRLEDVGADIIDYHNGLDEIFSALRIEDSLC
ncbi:hypothetical protein N7450_003910 [Penicillium hetheringtonii]|uniref:Uncharacterized protein n=1 Tax=Penicillium hetheringtonii TaxID=911720 RepID=A0AAD6DP25_9EURO|nr:hypothetical protein N7450_003910 [Penicillium hetheringtonii]